MRLKSVLVSSVQLFALACGNSGGGGGMRDSGPGSGRDGSAADCMRVSSSSAASRDASCRARDGAVARDGGEKQDSGSNVPACDASRAPSLPPLGLEAVVSGVNELMYAAQPKGSDDWYLVRHTGEVMLFTGGALLPDPFLDLSNEARATGNDERGLLSIAFSPEYATDHTFYVALTTIADRVDRVREYKRSTSDPHQADTSSMRELLTLPPSEVNHNGGTVRVGPDGLLYVGTGDGGGGCNDNQPGAPQDKSSLFGKILRLDPSKKKPFAAEGNPYSGAAGDARVLHIGLRNPFRFGFDRLTGDLFIGDVGQDQYEEVDFAPAASTGLNFGWPAFEGLKAAADASCPGNGPLPVGAVHTPPIFIAEREKAPGDSSTPNFEDYVSVIGGVVYRGKAIAALSGAYVFGDYQGLAMVALYQCGSETSPRTTLWKNRNLDAPSDPYFVPKNGAPALGSLQAIVEDNDGELYLIGNASTLYKVVAN